MELHIPQTSQNNVFVYLCVYSYHFPKRQILDSSILKEFVEDNFEFDEDGRKLYKQVENTEGKGEIARNEQFLPFPQRFQTTCTADT